MLFTSFIPSLEKEWEAKLFIDEAIKNNVEFHLEAIARALCGSYSIKFEYAERDNYFERTETIKDDNGNYFGRTEKFKIKAYMKEFIFYADNRISIWLQIINFWAGECTIFPCGGANF